MMILKMVTGKSNTQDNGGWLKGQSKNGRKSKNSGRSNNNGRSTMEKMLMMVHKEDDIIHGLLSFFSF